LIVWSVGILLWELWRKSLPSFPLEEHWPPTDKKRVRKIVKEGEEEESRIVEVNEEVTGETLKGLEIIRDVFTVEEKRCNINQFHEQFSQLQGKKARRRS